MMKSFRESGDRCLQRGHLDSAIDEYYQGLLEEVSDPDELLALLTGLAETMHQLGKFKECLLTCQVMLMVQPGCREARMKMAMAWQKLGQPLQAVEVLLSLCREMCREMLCCWGGGCCPPHPDWDQPGGLYSRAQEQLHMLIHQQWEATGVKRLVDLVLLSPPMNRLHCSLQELFRCSDEASECCTNILTDYTMEEYILARILSFAFLIEVMEHSWDWNVLLHIRCLFHLTLESVTPRLLPMLTYLAWRLFQIVEERGSTEEVFLAMLTYVMCLTIDKHRSFEGMKILVEHLKAILENPTVADTVDFEQIMSEVSSSLHPFHFPILRIPRRFLDRVLKKFEEKYHRRLLFPAPADDADDEDYDEHFIWEPNEYKVEDERHFAGLGESSCDPGIMMVSKSTKLHHAIRVVMDHLGEDPTPATLSMMSFLSPPPPPPLPPPPLPRLPRALARKEQGGNCSSSAPSPGAAPAPLNPVEEGLIDCEPAVWELGSSPSNFGLETDIFSPDVRRILDVGLFGPHFEDVMEVLCTGPQFADFLANCSDSDESDDEGY